MIFTRPDIAHAVGVVSKFKYFTLFWQWQGDLQGFVDADLGGDVDSSKSTSGYIYIVGSTVVSWMFRLQKCVALSSTEAEYVAIAEAGKEKIWLGDYLAELGKK
ncbi:hypothetical protein T459_35173 [Capsicum annuum]|uniref:Retrovirus-related Pol polyprotein from transposon TNT 1-94 n=1 Tax=Capsicum annuum TaxID=4072 RepID=A0A2G2XU07_CAPAN|nr:hypothetical protein T459_35173 [Capsicum annuum]